MSPISPPQFQLLPPWKRAVVKVGSNLIAPEGQRLSTRYLLGIARLIIDARSQGREVVLVSSGAVAAGRALLGETEPLGIPAKQALAALGQPRMFEAWARLFDFPCAQVLLGYDDLQNRRRFVNAKNTLREVLRLQALPIVNENDSVAVDELRVGDNDNLAAHVAVLVEADLLLMLSDIDGLFDADPRSNPHARLLQRVTAVDDAVMALAGGAGSGVGTGGMRTKLEAAAKAGARGIPSVIANGRDGSALEAIVRGECRGTLFDAASSQLSAKDHWMRHALASQGRIVVDAGAARALRSRGASLLPAGVIDVAGSFRAGDAVEVFEGEGGSAFAKGIAQYDAIELKRIAGRPSAGIAQVLGYAGPETAIHRDDLVLL
jgi:glutamate 5-kinase